MQCTFFLKCADNLEKIVVEIGEDLKFFGSMAFFEGRSIR